ncbi:leukotriene C4 synthase isoform X2 [Manis javanica]|uniref:leukotriene C4 synthase isoform X2 n=2 Tax=Manis TaxID=9973 RepID=UPI003C6D7DFD
MLCPAPAPSGSGFRPLSLTRLLVLSGCAHTPAPHPHTEKGRREWATLLRGQPLRSTGTEKSSAASPAPGPDGAACTMKDEVALLATVTLLGVLLQAYFSLRVISARRAFRVAPPLTTGPPEFERVYRAQVNCSEYFPLFLATLWVAGIFFHEGAAALCGLVYLFARLRYFQGYSLSVQQRLAPLYASARALWLLVVLAALGLLAHFLPAALRSALLGQLRTLLPRA